MSVALSNTGAFRDLVQTVKEFSVRDVLWDKMDPYRASGQARRLAYMHSTCAYTCKRSPRPSPCLQRALKSKVNSIRQQMYKQMPSTWQKFILGDQQYFKSRRPGGQLLPEITNKIARSMDRISAQRSKRALERKARDNMLT